MNWLIGKNPDTGKDWGQEEKGVSEDEMVGWHHRLNGYEFVQTPGDGEGQGSLMSFSPSSHRVGHDWSDLAASCWIAIAYSLELHLVAQSFATPWNCSIPGFPVLHHLLELAQTCPLSQGCHPTISSSVIPFSACPQSLPASGSFLMSQLFASVAKVLELQH